MNPDHFLASMKPLIYSSVLDILDTEPAPKLAETVDVIRGWTIVGVHSIRINGTGAVGLELRNLWPNEESPWPGISLTMSAGPVECVQHIDGFGCIIRHHDGRRVSIQTDQGTPA